MAANLRLVGTAPNAVLQRVAPRRKSDADYGRDGHRYLTPEQIARLVKAARSNRHGSRDALMISLAYQCS
jgi:integrase